MKKSKKLLILLLVSLVVVKSNSISSLTNPYGIVPLDSIYPDYDS